MKKDTLNSQVVRQTQQLTEQSLTCRQLDSDLENLQDNKDAVSLFEFISVFLASVHWCRAACSVSVSELRVTPPVFVSHEGVVTDVLLLQTSQNTKQMSSDSFPLSSETGLSGGSAEPR